MMLGSEEILDCITAALIHSDIFSSCDEEDHDEPMYHNKRCRYSTDSTRSCRSSLSQKSVSDISLCDSEVPCQDDAACAVPVLELAAIGKSPETWIPATSQQFTKSVVRNAVTLCSTVALQEPFSKSSNEIAETHSIELELMPKPSPDIGNS
jgi:hypothetical protein